MFKNDRANIKTINIPNNIIGNETQFIKKPKYLSLEKKPELYPIVK